MKGFRRRSFRAFAACAMLALASGGCAPAAPHSPPAAVSARLPGGKIFDKWCGDCHHTAEGPGSLALQRKFRGAIPAVLEKRSDLRPDYIRRVVRQGISFMPSFRKTEISDADLALLAAYLTHPQ
jgi:mono/diheme cytochrome c family protein